jgi:hypothetical protein
MTETHVLLASRFRDDAQALRARASVLAARAPGQRGGGPDADACRAMADACDRVSVLFERATDAAALEAAVPALERLLATERSADVRHVYAGAAARLRQALAPAGDTDEDDEDEDEELDDEPDDTDDEG